MRSVMCGPERRSFPLEVLGYHRVARTAWSFQCDGIEILVGGGPKGPHPDRLEVAERVATRVEAFGAAADEYIAGFVDTDRFGFRRPWQVESIEFGLQRSDEADEFEVLLVVEGDIYGVWGVRFRPDRSSSNHFYPIEFRRRQR